MKRFFGLTVLALMGSSAFAGGILTNTNQSVQFVRTLSRNATIDIDAPYFNPAGTALLDDGLKLSFDWQMPIQERTTTCDLPYLKNHEYKGDIFVPFYPTLFVSWKKERLALSLNAGPIGGGGSASYDKGLASFEKSIAAIPLALNAKGYTTTGYDVDIQFKGGSVMYAGQIGVAYAISDKLSASVGARLTYVKNKYEGHIRDIKINPQVEAMGLKGDMISAPAFFSQAASAMKGAADQYAAAGMTNEAQEATVNYYTMQAYAAATSGMEVDASQSGLGVAPIIGLDYKVTDWLNLAARFEFNTKIELTNDSDAEHDGNGMFKDDSTFRKDVPGIFAAGADLSITDKFRTSLSFTYYLDKKADWEGREKLLDHNMYEFALGLEYDINSMLTLSCGYQRGITGATDEFQTDMDFSLNTNTFGLGGRINIGENLNIDFGYMLSTYDKVTVEKTDANTGLKYNESFDKINNTFALGVCYKF